MIACKVGTKITWDEKTRQILDDPKAAELLKRPYRAPWRHPYDAPDQRNRIM